VTGSIAALRRWLVIRPESASVMPVPERPKNKPLGERKDPRAMLALRLDRAANDLNPMLAVLAIGLLVLNLTLYIGMAVSRDPSIWAPPRHIGADAPPATAPADPFNSRQ
jgi:hypothetical protein